MLTQELVTRSSAGYVRALRNQARQYLKLPPLSEGTVEDDVLQLNFEVGRLTPEQVQSLPRLEEKKPFSFVDQSETAPLRGLSNLISLLVKRGFKTDDLSTIYCENCDLRRAALDGMKFDKGYFRGANFSFASLHGASFDGADLRDATFYGANLTQARLRIFKDQFGLSNNAHVDLGRISWDTVAQLPKLDCADIRGADFAGRPLVWVQIDYENGKFDQKETDRHVYVWVPALSRATIDKSTNFTPVTFAWSVGISAANTKVDEELFDVSLPVTESLSHSQTELRGTDGESPKVRFAFVRAATKWKTRDSPKWIDQAIASSLVDIKRGNSIEDIDVAADNNVFVSRSSNNKSCNTSEAPDEEQGIDWIANRGKYPQ